MEKLVVKTDGIIFRINEVKTNNYRKLNDKKLQVFLIDNKKSLCLPVKNVDLALELNNGVKNWIEYDYNAKNFYFEQMFARGEKKEGNDGVIDISYLILLNKKEKLAGGEWFDISVSALELKKEQTKNGVIVHRIMAINLENENSSINSQLDVMLNLEGEISIKTLKSELEGNGAEYIFLAIQRLKSLVKESDVIFSLMEDEFTIADLKQSFELILEEKLIDANFRRDISQKVVSTGKILAGKGHRTSKLFRAK